jgi:hypothetical protein
MDLSLYEVYLFFHILAAILFLGAATIATSLFPRHANVADLRVAQILHRTTLIYGTASIAVPIFGLLTADRVNYMDAGWVQAALGIFLGNLVALFVYIIPTQRRIVAGLNVGTEPPAGSLDQLRGISGIYALLWLVVLYLMVTKPF